MKQADSRTQRSAERREHPARIQVITRAASILRALENQHEGLSLSEIALRVGLPRSTVQRIVTSLAEEQFLIAASPKSRVRLGPALIRLAKSAKLEISPLVRPHLESLSEGLGETVDLSVIQGRSAVFVDQVPGTHRLRAVSAIGERFPLHCTACGKALLAALPDSQHARYTGDRLKTYTDNTQTDPELLRDEIAGVRSRSYAIDEEEHTEGISAIGTWFEDSYGRAYAISIPAPTVRFIRNRQQFADALLECREQIIDMLGN